MSSPDAKDLAKQFSCPYSAGMEFEQVLRKAQALVSEADLEGALELLSHLEKKYVNAAKLFDLLGDVLLRRGSIEEGIRYKTLHEILKGTFKIAAGHAVSYGASELHEPHGGRPASTVPDRSPVAFKPPTPEKEAAGISMAEEEPGSGEADFIPVTAAMGQEFMRQGHFDRALEIFNLLMKKNPEDESLLQAREKARKKSREKKLLGVLRKWLENIEQMKSGRSAGA